jgi:hypothetical protein
VVIRTSYSDTKSNCGTAPEKEKFTGKGNDMSEWFRRLRREYRLRRALQKSHTHADRVRLRKLRQADQHPDELPYPLGPINADREFITRYGDPFA